MFRRDRSLHETNRKIHKRRPDLLQAALEELLHARAPLRVLEVGFGHGRALLELAWRFRERPIRFFGVDKLRVPPMTCREDLRQTLHRYEIAEGDDASRFELPEIDFYDARELHFPDASVDLVYSAVTIRHIERKAEFLEEVCRVLAPGGRALLHVGESNWDYPYSRACGGRLLTPYLNRFVLRHDDELIPLPAYLRLFEGGAFRFSWLEGSRCVLRVDKTAHGRLELGLRFDPELAIPMQELPHRHKSGKVQGGFRSVYKVRTARYRALFERGILSASELSDAS